MATFYDIDRANAKLPELDETLRTLRSLRSELVELRDRAVALAIDLAGDPTIDLEASPRIEAVAVDDETRRLKLRMQGIVDQMMAAVAEIDSWGIQLRDIPTGLVDFPALVAGRQVWLCWRLGEPRVEWWHELDAGVRGRQPLENLH